MNILNYTEPQSLDNTDEVANATNPQNPAIQREEDITEADTIATNAIEPIAHTTNIVQCAITEYYNGTVTADQLITVVNDSADMVAAAIAECKGKVFLILLETNQTWLKTSYGEFTRDNTQRAKFIGKSDYYSLRTLYQRYHELPDDLQQYVDKSKLTNAKCALNMPDYSPDHIRTLMHQFPDGIPGKAKAAKRLLPPPPPPEHKEKCKRKARNLSLHNIKLANVKHVKHHNYMIKSLAETHGCPANDIAELEHAYAQYMGKLTTVLDNLSANGQFGKEDV